MDRLGHGWFYEWKGGGIGEVGGKRLGVGFVVEWLVWAADDERRVEDVMGAGAEA